MADNLQIITYNVNGIRDNLKRRKVFNFLHDKKYDIMFLQETHSTANTCKVWKNEWGGQAFFAHGCSNARGVAILVKKHVNLKIQNIVRDIEGRYIILKVGYMNATYMLASVYAPNKDDPDFFASFFHKYENFDTQHAIIAGDFNTVLSPKDIKGGKGHTYKVYNLFS